MGLKVARLFKGERLRKLSPDGVARTPARYRAEYQRLTRESIRAAEKAARDAALLDKMRLVIIRPSGALTEDSEIEIGNLRSQQRVKVQLRDVPLLMSGLMWINFWPGGRLSEWGRLRESEYLSQAKIVTTARTYRSVACETRNTKASTRGARSPNRVRRGR